MRPEEDNGKGRSPLGEARREQVKLTASYLNGIAIGLVLVAGLSVPTTLLMNAQDSSERWVAFAFSLFSIGLSPYLHIWARRVLKGLDR